MSHEVPNTGYYKIVGLTPYKHNIALATIYGPEDRQNSLGEQDESVEDQNKGIQEWQVIFYIIFEPQERMSTLVHSDHWEKKCWSTLYIYQLREIHTARRLQQ